MKGGAKFSVLLVHDEFLLWPSISLARLKREEFRIAGPSLWNTLPKKITIIIVDLFVNF